MTASFVFVSSHPHDTDSVPGTTFVTPAWNVVAGNLIIIGVRWDGGGASDAATVSVADTAGNTYVVDRYKRQPVAGPNDENIAFMYCLSALGHASNIVTVTLSAARPGRNAVFTQYSYSGTIRYSTTKGSGIVTSPTTATPWTTSPALAARKGDLVVGWFGKHGAPGNEPAIGWTVRQNDQWGVLFVERIPIAEGTFTAEGGTVADSYVALSGVFETPTPPYTQMKQFSNGTFQSQEFQEVAGGFTMRMFSNSTIQIKEMQEIAGAPRQMYSNGTYICPLFIEI